MASNYDPALVVRSEVMFEFLDVYNNLKKSCLSFQIPNNVIKYIFLFCMSNDANKCQKMLLDVD